MTQKAFIIRTGPDGHEGLEDVNIELERGWRVAHVSPMGGAAAEKGHPSHAALVILEHRDEHEGPTLAVEALEQLHEEKGEIVEVVKESREVVEGNGAEP